MQLINNPKNGCSCRVADKVWEQASHFTCLASGEERVGEEAKELSWNLLTKPRRHHINNGVRKSLDPSCDPTDIVMNSGMNL